MIRLQQWESGPYFTAFSLHIPDMRSFIDMREIVKICPRSHWVLIEPVFRFRTPKSDRLLNAAPFTSAHDPVNQVKLAATVPTPMNCVSTVSPALTGAGLVNDPDMIRCPACNRLP